MKWNHQFDHYYSEDCRYMIERSPYGGWDLYTKSRPDLTMYDLHVINCDLLREAKEAASSHDVETATREALARAGMLAQETTNNIEEEHTMTREEKKITRQNIRTAVELHQEHRSTGPVETVAALVLTLGYPAAVETVATLVNSVGDWDARITISARLWAADRAADRETLTAAGIYQPSEIHPAHIDQIAREMMAYAPAWDDQEEAPAEEIAPAAPVKKHYQNETTGESTTGAALALSWHRRGDLLTVTTTRGAEVLRIVTITGAPTKPARAAEDENRAHCEHIALELDAYVNGEVYRCPDCGEILHLPDDVGDRYRCPHCETVNDVDDLEQLGIWDFLSDVYDVEYRCGSDRELRSVRVMVACGGPNIYLDSASKDVELYWWNERSRYPMSYEAAEALDQWAEDCWNM